MCIRDRGGAYQTFYLGSQKGKTNGFLRCYDKKAEQLQTMGFRYGDALNCDSWVRFEAVYRHDYAHQITEGLLSVKTVQELSQLIAGYILSLIHIFPCFIGIPPLTELFFCEMIQMTE